jgi:PAS domain S-box-containing protein
MTVTVPFDLRLVLEAITDVVFAVDADACIRYINHVLPGFDKASVLGSSSLSYLHPDHQADYLRRLERLFAVGGIDEYEIRSEAAHHEGFNWYFVRMRRLEYSEPPVAVVSCTDITERKRLETHREALLGELHGALAQVRALEALVPTCASCRAVQRRDGRWEPVTALADAPAGLEVRCPTCIVGAEAR